jgi:hypothetical protein
MTSILGPFFHISAWPDNTIFKSEPDVGWERVIVYLLVFFFLLVFVLFICCLFVC